MSLGSSAPRDGSTLRQRACAAGMDPADWYAVAWDADVRAEQAQEVRFWGRSVALYRTKDRALHAVENRCAHRQLLLSEGRVEGCRLTCRYHGWSYDTDGRLVDIPHELFGRPFPTVQLRTYPVAVRYGLVWIFFGDSALAPATPLPVVEELEGPAPWTCIPFDMTWRAHHAFVVNNVMDSTHVGPLHRSFLTRSFVYGRVTRCEAVGDEVIVGHDIQPNPEAVLWAIAPRVKVPAQEVGYRYPRLWVDAGGIFKMWVYLLPMDARTTRVFMLACTERLKLPFTPFEPPRPLVRLGGRIAHALMLRPTFEEDRWAAEAEQRGFDQNGEQPALDLHPVTRLCYELTVRRWEEAKARDRAPGATEAQRPQT